MASTSLSNKSGVRTSTPSLKKTTQLYKAQLLRLEAKHEQLIQKRESVNNRGFVILDENKTASSRPSRHTVASPSRRGGAPVVRAIEASVQVERTSQLKEPKTEKSKSQQTLVEQTEGYHSDVNSLISTATSILIESVELRLGFLRDILSKLNTLYHEAPKLPTPPELGYQRYDEWVGSNQRLLELNAQLYDIERLKFELKQKKSAAQKVKKSKVGGEDSDLAGGLFLKSSVERIQSLMSRFSFQIPLQDRTATYLQELLNPRGDKTTLEAQKIQEYVRVCLSNIDTPTDTVIGAHPESYQQFMAVLCSYIVEKQREVQGEQLPHALVFSTVERHLMPQILPAVIRHVTAGERDAIIEKQCDRYSTVTLSQLKINAKLHSNELIPFFESITQLRASYFSPTPTDKMYAVVAAAKALYERLGAMGESSIDGDSFLDLWVYVILRAKVKDLATNLHFMVEYGNPTLALDEAGYYLTCLEAAVTFIESLEPQQLDITGVETDYVVCECSKFQELSAHPSASFQVLNARAELLGYRVGVVKDWALNKSKLVSAVLIATGDSTDVAIVSVIRFSLDYSSVPCTEYLTDALREVSLNGLSCSATPLGLAVIADTADMNPHSLLVLPTGDYDAHQAQLMHVLQLIRLGSKEREDISLAPAPSMVLSQSVENGFLYVATPNATTLPMAIRKNRSRVNSDGSWLSLSTNRYGYSDDRRAASFTESTAYNASPYLVGMESEVSLHTLPFSSPDKQHKAGGKQQTPGWFGRKFKSRKDKSRDHVWHSTSDDRHRDMRSQYPDSNGEITREYPSSRTKYTVSGGRDGYSSLPSVENSPAHQNSRNVQTVEVEVHESIHQSHTLDSVVIGNPNNSIQNGLFDSSIELNKSQKQSSTQKPPASLDVVHASLHPGSGNSAGNELSKNENGEIEFGTSPTISLSSQRSISLAEDPFLTISAQFFSEENVRFLEGNFLLNHMVSGDYDAVRESMTTIIRQAQLFLQRLNYLSSSHRLDGLYSDSTLSSVQRFQRSHNTHRSTPLLTLPENGLLTPPTMQYLRQALLTLYANMIRLGFDKHLGVNFDPTSTDVRYVDLFKKCVQKFQESNNLIGRCQLGVLCSNTVNKMRHVLRTDKNFTR